MKINDTHHEQLKKLVESANEFHERGQHAQALERFTAARARCEKVWGFSPGHICWFQARAAEAMGDMEAALGFVGEALARDPMNHDFHSTFGAVSSALRSALADPKLDPTDESIPRIYAALTFAGETDVACHLALARHHLKAGRRAEARSLVSAVNLLAPASVDAWRLRVTVARTDGDEALAMKCEGEAECRSDPSVPFAVIGMPAEA